MLWPHIFLWRSFHDFKPQNDLPQYKRPLNIICQAHIKNMSSYELIWRKFETGRKCIFSVLFGAFPVFLGSPLYLCWKTTKGNVTNKQTRDSIPFPPTLLQEVPCRMNMPTPAAHNEPTAIQDTIIWDFSGVFMCTDMSTHAIAVVGYNQSELLTSPTSICPPLYWLVQSRTCQQGARVLVQNAIVTSCPPPFRSPAWLALMGWVGIEPGTAQIPPIVPEVRPKCAKRAINRGGGGTIYKGILTWNF